ncbi:MAG: ABC transporter permease [Candidatus Acidiferrales bacterium]
METIWQDLRYGFRMLRRSRGFTVVAVLTLAVGIGANAAIFSIINTVLLRPLPFPDSSRIALVWDTDPNRNVYRGVASPAEFLDWRAQSHVFEELSAWRTWFYTLTGTGEPEQVWGAHASANFFRLFGVTPALGRDFLPEEERPGHEQVVIISNGIWQRRYGGAPGIIGRSILVDDKPYTVVGVLPRGFSLFGTTRQFDLWMPFAFDGAQLNRANHSVITFARLRKGVTYAQAQAEMETIVARLKKQYPGVDQENGVRVVRFRDDLSRGLKPALLVLLGAVGFVLLIACANVANLMLARAATREREIAVRATLGAGRRRILRQLLTESVLLALIGGALGLLVAFGGLHLLRAAFPPEGGYAEIPHAEWIGVDGAVLAFTFAVSLLTGIIFGFAPAIQISRSELFESLKEGSRGSTGGRRSQFVRSSLVVAEIALSLILLIGAGLLIRSFFLLMSENLGFNPSNVLTMQVWLPESHYASGPPLINFYQRVIEKVAAQPGVKSASAVNFLPLSGWGDFCNFDIAGRAAPPPDEPFTAQYRVMDWRYLQTMNIPLKEGRDFSSGDGPDTQGVVLVNEALAHRYWPHEDPIGKQIRIHFPETRSPWQPATRDSWLTIVGLVQDVREWEWGEEKVGQVYLLYTQNPSRIMRLVVRANGDPSALTASVRHAIESVDSNQPVTEIRTMDEFLAAAVAQRRLSMLLLGCFAAIATILAAVGIYGVMAYGVTQRSHEIGIRMALGAEPGDVLRMIVVDGMRLAVIGLFLGIVGSTIATRYLENQLYGVKSTDPVTFVGVVLGLAIVAVAACYFPARRATRVDPLTALRYE